MERYDALLAILTITPRRITVTLCNAKIQPLQQNERLDETYLLVSSTDGVDWWLWKSVLSSFSNKFRGLYFELVSLTSSALDP